MKIAIVIDSASGIKNLKDYSDLFLVPLMISKENGEQIADDEHFSSEEFYKLNESQLLKTSQSIPGVMLNKWDQLLCDYDKIVCILISKGLSGQYNTFKMFSSEDKYKNKVYIVDTNGVSILLKRQVDFIQKAIKNGLSIEKIIHDVEEISKNLIGYIIPKKLDQLVRGGRISKAAAGLAKILKITPILKYDGTIDKEGKTRTFKKAVSTALDLLKKTYSNELPLDIAYSKSNIETIDLVKSLIDDKGFNVGIWEELPNIITCHTGLETFAFIPNLY
ncbi:DegV family protein [Spiroplasma turonicum]|uniref:DegV family protein n=1 Tax=Spiroplasma turonicum TaxID=216946 RepID=A0A0K1P646_9MOLU|nr:DegV family protein [Spiroplasma turonicum]AKU79392.1 DegV family protein [Spiroplasma turonicum]ALX70413.1 fatty acid-binding protein DegV [Spiroplasma turonicum]